MKKLLLISIFSLFPHFAFAGSIPPNCPTNGGSQALNYSTSTNAYSCNSVQTGLDILGTSTSSTAPHISGDTTSGFYSDSAGHVSTAIGGSQVSDITSSGIHITGVLSVSGISTFANGSSTVPSITFNGSSSDGFSWSSSHNINAIINGGTAFQFTSGSSFAASNANGGEIHGGAASGTAPVFVPNKSDEKAGIGANAAGNVSVITDNSTVATESTRFSSAGLDLRVGNYLVNGTQIAASNLSNGTTGSGAIVLRTSPSLVTPALGVATATSINNVAITAPATGSTLTIADGKTLTQSNTLTYTGTDGSSVNFGAGGTVLYSGGSLGIALGTSVSVTNPSISSDVTSGFYTAGAGKVDVGIGGSNVGEWTSSGEAITGTLSATSTISSTATTGNDFSCASTTGTCVNAGSITTGTGISISGATTGKGLVYSLANSATTGSALSVTGSNTLTGDYSGAFINLTPTRTMTAAATRAESGNIINAAPTYSITGSNASVMNVSGPMVNLNRTISNTSSSGSSAINLSGAVLSVASAAPTRTNPVTNTAPVLTVTQNDTQASGTALTVTNSGTGYGATIVGGNVGIGTATPASLFSVGSTSQFTVDTGGQYGSSSSSFVGAGSAYYWAARSLMRSPSDGVIKLSNQGETDFGRLQLGGTTSSFPAIKRSAATIAFRLADDSADAAISASSIVSSGNLTVAAGGGVFWTGRSLLFSPADGIFEMTNNAQTGFTRLELGGTTSSFPSIKRNSTAINFRLADDSADAAITAAAITASGSVTATALIPTSSSIPTDGIYLPTANTTGIADRSLIAASFTNPASSVDYLAFNGAATASPAYPTITATGTDTNIGINLVTKGTGALQVNGAPITGVIATNPTIQTFTSSTGTYTTPANVKWIEVVMVGGGGGGGSGGSASTASGGTGGNTTFGTTLLAANGGSGGGAGAGGTASLGTGPIGTAMQGGYGEAGVSSGSLTGGYFPGGIGCASPLGGNGAGIANNTGTAAVTNTGSGGGGGSIANVGGQVGTGGACGGYVDAIISSPSATYSYAVGAAGTGATAGTNGYAGGAGGSGYIKVIEHYNY